MQEQKDKDVFITLMNPITIKTILMIGNKFAKLFFYQLIESITNYDIRNYSLGTEKYDDFLNAVNPQEDIILISPNQDVVINLELNRVESRITLEKNRRYVHRLDRKYNPSVESNTQIIQINFHDYSHKNKKGNIVLKSCEKISNRNITIYDFYIRDIKFVSKLIDNRFYNDLALFSAKSNSELYHLSYSSLRRRSIMKELQSLKNNKDFMDLYNHEEYLESLKADFCKKGYEEGIRHQKEVFIKKMFDNKENIEKISMYTGYTKDELLDKLIDNTLDIVN